MCEGARIYSCHKPLKRRIGALQAAEKPIPARLFQSFVTGHDFSRADKLNRMSWASAPAKLKGPSESKMIGFSAACSAPAGFFNPTWDAPSETP
jgi:hypothetical protein